MSRQENGKPDHNLLYHKCTLLSLERLEMAEITEQVYQSDHDILIAMSVKLTRLLQDVEGIKETVTTNQESRLRALENFRWWVLGASSVLSFAGGLAAHVLLGK